MVLVRPYSRTVNGKAVEVSGYERADRPSASPRYVSAARQTQLMSHVTKILPQKRWGQFSNNMEAYDAFMTSVEAGRYSPTEQNLYRDIYLWEGGIIADGDTVAGITTRALRWAKEGVDGLGGVNWPKDVPVEDFPAIYKNVVSEGLKYAGGMNALNSIGHAGMAEFIGDTIFREGSPDASQHVQYAINDARLANGQSGLPVDGKIGPDSVVALTDIASSQETRKVFASSLAKHRNKKYGDPGDLNRVRYFEKIASR